MAFRIDKSRAESTAPRAISLRRIASWRGLRVLAWEGEVLYASQGYRLVRWDAGSVHAASDSRWDPVAAYHPGWLRNLTARARLTYRLLRDGFHALAILDDKTMVAALPGVIATRDPESQEFRPAHRVRRGTRPLHITAVPNGNIYWGEYFDNRERADVNIYASTDRGRTWQVGYKFPPKTIRHVHNIVHDPWGECLWILTGDEGSECKVLRASYDLGRVETVLAGSQQARAVAAIPTKEALFLSTDTPLEKNHILRLARDGRVESLCDLPNSSIFGCRTAGAFFFSTMAEPSPVNSSHEVQLIGSADGRTWQILERWKKDPLPMRFFQYGNAILPNGLNTTNYLAATTMAVDGDDLVTTVWEVCENDTVRTGPSCPPRSQTV
jgi:hypothetical protein